MEYSRTRSSVLSILRLKVIYALSPLCLSMLVSCGLTVTKERPAFEDLEPHEQSVVDLVLESLKGFNEALNAENDADPIREVAGIAAVLSRENINVSFDGILVSANIGDGLIHVADWENLSTDQRLLVQEWFQSGDLEIAKTTYSGFFYRFLAVAQGAKQFIYETLGTEWVFKNLSLYTVENDSIRLAFSYLNEVADENARAPAGITPGFVSQSCAALIRQYASRFGETFGRSYFNRNARELIADGKRPTGYMYYLCRMAADAEQHGLTFSGEVANIR